MKLTTSLINHYIYLIIQGVHFSELEEKQFLDQMKQKRPTKAVPKPAKITNADEDWHRVGFIGISNWDLGK